MHFSTFSRQSAIFRQKSEKMQKKMRFFSKNDLLFLKNGVSYCHTRKQQASVAQLVEHHVANVIVAGSSPVSRSILNFNR